MRDMNNLAFIMVFMLDGNLEIGAHGWSYLICSRHLFRSKTVTNLIFLNSETPIFLHVCATGSEILSNIRKLASVLPAGS